MGEIFSRMCSTPTSFDGGFTWESVDVETMFNAMLRMKVAST